MSNFFIPTGAALTSNRDDWETPQWLFDKYNKDFNFTLDPCASHHNHKCDKYFTKDENGLIQDWSDEVVFCNPPYGRNIKDWVKKCHDEQFTAESIVLLVPARTDTRWFHDYIYDSASIEFLRGRLRFEIGGVPQNSAPFPSMICVWSR